MIRIIILLLLIVLLFCALYWWATTVFSDLIKGNYSDMENDSDIMRRNIAITVNLILTFIVILLRILYLRTPTVFTYLMMEIYSIVIFFILPAAVKRIRITWDPWGIILVPLFFDRNMSLDKKIDTSIISVFAGFLACLLATSLESILGKAILSYTSLDKAVLAILWV